jgi:hypothetical protein
MYIYFILGKLIMLSLTQPIHHSKQWVHIELGTTKKELVHIPSSTISVTQHRHWICLYTNHRNTNTNKTKTANTKTEHHSQVDGIPALHLQGPRFISQSRDRLPPQQGVLWSCLLPPYKCQNSLPTKTQPLPSTLFPIQYSLTSLTLIAVKSELQKATLNKSKPKMKKVWFP